MAKPKNWSSPTLLMDALELAARFSFITNALRYCGPKEANEQFRRYFSTKGNAKEVRESLLRFEGLPPYLSAIAKKHGLGMFDGQVVEAYWLGNELLDGFTIDDLKAIVDGLVARGLPQPVGNRLKAEMPTGFVPHHNFNVFYVGVGRTTGSVPTTVQNMDNCRISSGKVAEVIGTNLIVATTTLAERDGKIIEEESTKTIAYLPELMPDVKKGDVVAIITPDKDKEQFLLFTENYITSPAVIVVRKDYQKKKY